MSFAHTIGSYEDEAALAALPVVDVVTYEFENVPARAAEVLQAHCEVRRGRRLWPPRRIGLLKSSSWPRWALPPRLSQRLMMPVVWRAVAQLEAPSILKTRRFGYDGKGQAMVREGSDLSALYRSLGSAPCILELCALHQEVSIVAARGVDGSFAAFDVCENVHEHHILSLTKVPAGLSSETSAEALEIAQKIADALDYVGVIAVELFVSVEKGREVLRVNEIAPRSP